MLETLPIDMSTYHGPTGTIQQVHRAAANAGSALAMSLNTHAAGRPDKTELWTDEHRVWADRQQKLIAEAPLGKCWLRSYAGMIASQSFGDAHVPHPVTS